MMCTEVELGVEIECVYDVYCTERGRAWCIYRLIKMNLQKSSFIYIRQRDTRKHNTQSTPNTENTKSQVVGFA